MHASRTQAKKEILKAKKTLQVGLAMNAAHGKAMPYVICISVKQIVKIKFIPSKYFTSQRGGLFSIVRLSNGFHD
jgi:hypothetical protein